MANPFYQGQTFSDETKTGRHRAFRGRRRALIGARAADQNGFDWVLSFRRDFLPAAGELKSADVLRVMDSNKCARIYIEERIRHYSIFIVDFYESTKEFISGLFRCFGRAIPQGLDVYQFLTGDHVFGQHSEAVLNAARRGLLHYTPIPKVEGLVHEAMQHAGVPPALGPELINRDALLEMNEQEFKELTIRFAMAFADVIDPAHQVDLILKMYPDVRYWNRGLVALRVVEHEVGWDRYYDHGASAPFEMLEQAHVKVTRDMQKSSNGQLLRVGRTIQEDSKLVLGIQAADIACGLAARLYELYPEDRRQGAYEIRKFFARVLLNTEWIEIET